MRVLVTGAGGLIGGALCQRLRGRSDIELLALGRSLPTGADGVVLDLLDATALRRTLADFDPDVVIHAAGRAAGAPGLMLRDNALATVGLAQAMATEAPDAGLILLGSAAQYGGSPDRRPWRESDPCQPQHPYGLSKHVGERCALLHGRGRITALRLFNLALSEPVGAQLFGRFLTQAVEALAGPGPPRMTVGPLDAVRDFVTLDDVGKAVEAVVDRGVWGEVINLASGQGRTMRSLIEAALAEIGGGLSLEEREAPAGEGGYLSWSVGDPQTCRRLLGFAPSGELAAVVRQAAAWVRAGVAARRDR